MAAKFPSAIAGDGDLLILKNRAQTTLVGALNASATTFTLASDAFDVNVAITIDAEIIVVLAKTGAQVTNCTRGFDGTAAASHANGALVSAYLDAIHHNQVSAEIQAIETALGTGLSNVPALIPNPMPVANGGTGSGTAAGARTNLSAAKSGANSDITSLTAISTPLSAPQGGTGSAAPTNHAVVIGQGASALAYAGPGTAGQILTSNGGSADPTFQAAPTGLLSKSATDYDFTPQQPGGSLIVGVNVITLSPVPAGVNGTDLNHAVRISGGVGTGETPLILGGTAVAGAGSGTLIISCANTHSGAWQVSSASGGIAEALQAGITAGIPFEVQVSKNTTIYGPVKTVGVGNFTLRFVNSPTLSFSYSAAVGQIIMMDFEGAGKSLGVNTTTTYSSLALAGAGPAITTAFDVTSASGYAAGDLAFLNFVTTGAVQGGTGNFLFSQIVRLKSVVGATITPYECVRIPLTNANTDASNSMYKVSMANNVSIVGPVVIDGSGATGGADFFAIRLQYTSHCRIADLTFQSWNGSGLLSNYEYRNQYRDLQYNLCGNAGYAAHYIFWGSYGQEANINFDRSTFAFQHMYCNGYQQVNVGTAGTAAGRSAKMVGCAWFQMANLDVSDASAASGLSLQGGCFRNTIANIIANNCAANGGIHMGGSQNCYNTITGILAFGCTFGDIATYQTDHHNVFQGSWQINLQNGTDDTFTGAIRDRCMAFNSATQTGLANGGVPTALSWDTNLVDWSVFVSPASGVNFALTASPTGTAMHEGVSHPTRFYNRGPSGFFRINCCWKVNADATGTFRELTALVTAVSTSTFDVTGALVGPISGQIVRLDTPPFYMGNLDYVEVFAVHNAAGTLSAVGGAFGNPTSQSWIYIERVM